MTARRTANLKCLRRGFSAFERLILRAATPVVLLEGSREVAPQIALNMERLAGEVDEQIPETGRP